MWKAGRYQPSAKSSLLTNFHVLKFRYSSVDDIAMEPNLVEGRAFALLIIQAISRHLVQLRVDFEASIPSGKRELSCEEFVSFLSHYLAYREYESCPTFAPKHLFAAARLRQQKLEARGTTNAAKLVALARAERGDDDGSGSDDDGGFDGSTTARDKDARSDCDDDGAASSSPTTATTMSPRRFTSPSPTAAQIELLLKNRRKSRPIANREDDIALRTLSRMERQDPMLLHDQLVRLYRAIDIEDSDGVCWTELSNFLSDAILQGDGGDGEGGGSGGGLQEEAPFELNPFVCDRPEHPVLNAKGITLGRNPVTTATEGFWLVQSRMSTDLGSCGAAPASASAVAAAASAGPGGAQVEAPPGGNFKCTMDIHNVRPPQNPHGNLLPSVHKALSHVFEENITQLEWIPISDLAVDEHASTIHDDVAAGSSSGGVPTTGTLAYSSTDLKLRLCEYRLQTGIMAPLGAVHAGEAFCTMSWSSYWKLLFCCSNSGTVSVWKVSHPHLAARAAAGAAASGSRGAYRVMEQVPCFERVHTFHEHKSTIGKVLFLPLDGSVATASLDPRLIVQDLECGAVVADLKGAQAGIRDISYHVDYHMIAACGYEPHVRLWVLHESTRSNSMVLQDRGSSSSTSAQHNLPLVGVHFIPSTSYLASADSAGLVRIWDIRTLRVVQNIDLELRRLPGHPRDKSIHQLSVLGDADMLLSSRRYTFLIHPLRASTATQRRSEAETFVAMGYSFSGSTVVTATPSSLQLWDLRAAAITCVFPSPVSTKEEEVTAIALDTQGRKIIVGFRGGRVRILSSVNGAVLKTIVVSKVTGVEIIDLKTLQMGGMCISVDSVGNVCCFADRDEGCQFAHLETCGFQTQLGLFTASSKAFPYLAVAHSKMLVTIFEIGLIASLPPAHHSWFKLGDGDSDTNGNDDGGGGGGASRQGHEDDKGSDALAALQRGPSFSSKDGAPLPTTTTTTTRRRNAVVSTSAVSMAQSVDIVAMEFCDAWRSLVVLDSSGDLHVCQIGPTKERGLRCTHRLHVCNRHPTSCITSPVVQPASSSSSYGAATADQHSATLTDAKWVPSCMQYVVFGHRAQLVLCNRRGAMVAIELSRYSPPQRRAQYVYDHESIWATSVRVVSTSLENSVTSRATTPLATPRREMAVPEGDEFDWADEVLATVARHSDGGAVEIAAAPRLPGLDRGPICAMMHVQALGRLCLLPSGSRSVYVVSLKGDHLLNELSLDNKGHKPAGSCGATSDVRCDIEALSLDDDVEFDIEVDSLLMHARSSVPSPRTHVVAPTARSPSIASAAQQPPRRPTMTASLEGAKPPKHGCVSVSDRPDAAAGERREGTILRPTSVLSMRSSKRSSLQPPPVATQTLMMHSSTPDATGTVAREVNFGGASLPKEVRTQTPAQLGRCAVRTSMPPKRKEASPVRSEQNDVSRSLYSRRLATDPCALAVSRQPRLANPQAMTEPPLGFSGILRAVHPLIKQHSRNLATAHVGFGSNNAAPRISECGGRAATPPPSSHGISSSALTVSGWRTSSVMVRPVSSTTRTLPPLPHSVNLRCKITPNKVKDPAYAPSGSGASEYSLVVVNGAPSQSGDSDGAEW